MEVILAGFLDTFTPTNILFIFMGISMGVFVGAIPGLNGPMAIALAVPMTYYMSPLAAIAFIVGINRAAPTVVLSPPSCSTRREHLRQRLPATMGIL